MSIWDNHTQALECEDIVASMQKWQEAIGDPSTIACGQCGAMDEWKIVYAPFLKQMGKTANPIVLACPSCAYVVTIEQGRSLHQINTQLIEVMEDL